MSKGHGGHPKEPTGQSWNNLSNKINNIVCGYNPKYEINMCESTLIHINIIKSINEGDWIPLQKNYKDYL